MKKILFFLFALFAIVACSDEDGNSVPEPGGENGILTTSADFIKLSDDSTNVAGVLRISSGTPQVELKWNVPAGCNIDTTLTKLDLSNGTGELPIKWVKHLSDSIYGPKTMAFNAGVLISSGDYCKYVNLLWADEVDSTAIGNQTQLRTRAADTPIPIAESLVLSQDIIELIDGNMGKQTFTVLYDKNIFFILSFTKDPETWKTELIEDNIPSYASEVLTSYEVGWRPDVKPTESFVSILKLGLGSVVTKYLYVVYIYKEPDAEIFRYDKCVPDTTTLLPSVGAVVAVSANTNQKWTLSSAESILSPVTGAASKMGLKTLAITIDDNPFYQERDVNVTVTPTAGGDAFTLKFRQQARKAALSITNIDPVPDSNIPAIASDVNVTVLTDTEWWIESLGTRIDCPKSKLSGKITIPANPGTTQREISVSVGHGSVIDSTFVYHQIVGSNLEYVSITPGGTVPVSGGIYTLTFEGDYAGGIQVEAYTDGVTGGLAVSNTAYNKKPQIQIPANTESLSKRKITFKYRKEGSSTWTDIIGLSKVQNGVEVTPNDILPGGDIPTNGGTYSCSFSGVYTGKIYLRAMTGGVELCRSFGEIGKAIKLTIPQNEGTKKRIIIFSYSGDGTNWIEMDDTRFQLVDAAIVGGNTTVNEFGDEEIIKGEIEL